MTALLQTDSGFEATLEQLCVKDGFNVRADTHPSETLVNSVAENGVLNPVHIRPDENGGWWIIDGERRFNAAVEAGLEAIPVIPHMDVDETIALVLSLSSNEDQKPLTREEKAEGFWRLQEEGVSHKEISRVMGCNVRLVKEYLAVMNEGSEGLQTGVLKPPKNGGIPVRAAAQAVELPEPVQEKLAELMAGKTTEEAMDLVNDFQVQVAKKSPKKRTKKETKAKPFAFGRDGRKRHALLMDLVGGAQKDDPDSDVLQGQMDVLLVIAGKKEITDLFEA